MNIPSNTVFDTLLDAVLAKMKAITTVNEAIIGTYDTVQLEQDSASDFPKIEILPAGLQGREYSDQQYIYSDYDFEIIGHTKAETMDRVTGNDIKTVESLGSAIKMQFFGFNDSSPHNDFLFVNSGFSLTPYYKEYSQFLNSVIFAGSMRCVTKDTAS